MSILYIIWVINLAFVVYYWILIARVILSWIRINPHGALRPIFEFIYDVTEPLLSLIRRFVPVIGIGGAGLDLSPIIALILIDLARRAIITILISL